MPAPRSAQAREDRPGRTAPVPGRLDDAVLGEEPGERRDADDGEVRQDELTEATGRKRASPPYRRMSCSSSMAWITDPEPRNSPALKNPCASSSAIANTYPVGPRPAPRVMYPIWLMVDPASDFLMSSLALPMMRAEQQRHRAHEADGEPRVRGQGQDRVGPDQQVDPGGDHGRRVDQRRHRGRALHGVQQPGLQRHLRGLPARAEQQEQPQRGGHAAAPGAHRAEHAGERHRAELGEHQEDGQGESRRHRPG